jgi:hypothetical protein
MTTLGKILAAALLLLGGCGDSRREASPPATTATTTTTIFSGPRPDPDACAFMTRAEVRLIAHQAIAEPVIRPLVEGQGSECTWALIEPSESGGSRLAVAVRRWPDSAAAKKAMQDFRQGLPAGAVTPVDRVGDEAVWAPRGEEKTLFAVSGRDTVQTWAPTRAQAISLGILTASRVASGLRPGAEPDGGK